MSDNSDIRVKMVLRYIDGWLNSDLAKDVIKRNDGKSRVDDDLSSSDAFIEGMTESLKTVKSMLEY